MVMNKKGVGNKKKRFAEVVIKNANE